MKQIAERLRKIKGVKAVRQRSNSLIEVEPFSRDLDGRDLRDIPPDLRKLTPEIKKALDDSKNRIKSWRFVGKPEKHYRDRSVKDSVSDREPLGYRPWKYIVEITERK